MQEHIFGTTEATKGPFTISREYQKIIKPRYDILIQATLLKDIATAALEQWKKSKYLNKRKDAAKFKAEILKIAYNAEVQLTLVNPELGAILENVAHQVGYRGDEIVSIDYFTMEFWAAHKADPEPKSKIIKPGDVKNGTTKPTR